MAEQIIMNPSDEVMKSNGANSSVSVLHNSFNGKRRVDPPKPFG